MLGICNGFQILTEAGLLPGALRPNASLSFVCRDVPLVVDSADDAVHDALRAGQSLTIPVKHGDGCWFADAELLAELETKARSCSGTARARTRTASVGDVAGVSNADANVFGLMPHPEHAVDPLLGSTDGALILGSLVDAARLSLARSSRRAPAQVPAAGKSRRLLECSAEPIEIARAQRHRTAPHHAVGRVRDAHQSLASLGLEQLDDRAEPPVAGPLRECHPLDERRRTEGSRCLCHAPTVAAHLQ